MLSRNRCGMISKKEQIGVISMTIAKKKLTQRAQNALETKSMIFDTALRLFTKYGYENVTIDEITKQAGVSKGTFYTHFDSKESVLVEQFNKIDHHYDEVFASISPSATAGERLLALVGAMTHYCADVCGIEVMRIVYASQMSTARVSKVLTNKGRRIYAYLNEIAALGKASGEFRCTLPDSELAELLMRFCRSLIYDWCLYGEEMALNREGQQYFKKVLKWMACEF